MIGAVLDLGSNTFHLLIADLPLDESASISIVHRSIYYTQLSREGGTHIPAGVFTDALNTLREIAEIIREFSPDFVNIVGTAVLRTANNRDIFITEAEKILQHPIDVIEGSQEAFYIAQGSLLHPGLKKGNNVIMDIGGGSTEFIYFEAGKIIDSVSTPLGVGVLKHRFFKDEILFNNDIVQAEKFVTAQLSKLKEIMNGKTPDRLGGASGTFETLEILLYGKAYYGPEIQNIPGSQCYSLFAQLGTMTLQQRLLFPNMPSKRADLITIGLWLIRETMKLLNCENLFASHYAIKEGILMDQLRRIYKFNQ